MCLSCVVRKYVNDYRIIGFEFGLSYFVECLRKSKRFLGNDVIVVVVVADVFVDFRGCNVF